MSEDLVDFRGKITLRTRVVLEAEGLAFDRETSAIAREILDAWAAKKIHGSTILQRRLKAEGITGADEGRAGNPKISAD